MTHHDLRQLFATRYIELCVKIPAVMTRPGKVGTTSLRKRQTEIPTLAAPKKAWHIDHLRIINLKKASIRKDTYALDYNCHLAGALASWLARPHWRQLNPPPARDCCHHPHHQPDPRQTRTLGRAVQRRQATRGSLSSFRVFVAFQPRGRAKQGVHGSSAVVGKCTAGLNVVLRCTWGCAAGCACAKRRVT